MTRPLLFSGPMVRAILEGRKTQTRRLRSVGRPGDRIWVRETWKPDPSFGYPPRTKASEIDPGTNILYRATLPEGHPKYDWQDWRPSIFMPRWASRITLEITGVREEHLQDISEADAIREGMEWLNPGNRGPITTTYARQNFRKLWDSLNAKRDYGWDSNPLVWVIDFKRV